MDSRSSRFGNLANTRPTHDGLDAAISLDPEFAAALAFKAWLVGIESRFGIIFLGKGFGVHEQERLVTLAERLARRALELDDKQARAHLALNMVHWHNRRWQAALESNHNAYASNPNDYVVENCRAWEIGRENIEEAVRHLERSIELNPADVANIWNVGDFLYQVERWDAAREKVTLVAALWPDAALGYAQLAKVSGRLGDSGGARLNAKLAAARNPGLSEFESMALAYGLIGDQKEAKRIFDLAGAGDESSVPNLEWQFWMHMAVKDYDSAVGYLERAIRDNFPFRLAMYLHDHSDHPDFDPIRSHPRFDELVRQVELPLDSAK